jgi:hypothetical protein
LNWANFQRTYLWGPERSSAKAQELIEREYLLTEKLVLRLIRLLKAHGDRLGCNSLKEAWGDGGNPKSYYRLLLAYGEEPSCHLLNEVYDYDKKLVAPFNMSKACKSNRAVH